MGGALLKVWNLPEKRLLNVEYEEFKSKILDRLAGIFPKSCRLSTAPALREKASHGDLDIICGTHRFFNSTELIKREFGFKPHVNSNVTSFPVDGFQVDVTFCPIDKVDSYVNYNSHGDTSNFLGRFFHKMGGHLGHSGLSFWIRQSLYDSKLDFLENDNILEKYVLTTDWNIILSILGLNYDTWKSGFNTQQDVFEWVATSQYFNADIFKFESLNHINHIRNKKRPMYAAFVKYLETNSWRYNKHTFQRREYYLPMWAELFPDLKRAIRENGEKYKKQKEIAAKFNGHIVMEVLDISDGKLVGQYISAFKKKFDKEAIRGMSKEQIISEIKNLNETR